MPRKRYKEAVDGTLVFLLCTVRAFWHILVPDPRWCARQLCFPYLRSCSPGFPGRLLLFRLEVSGVCLQGSGVCPMQRPCLFGFCFVNSMMGAACFFLFRRKVPVRGQTDARRFPGRGCRCAPLAARISALSCHGVFLGADETTFFLEMESQRHIATPDIDVCDSATNYAVTWPGSSPCP